MKTIASIALTLAFLVYPTFALGAQTASLDDSEKKKEAVGIVGFSFKYTGLDHPCIGNILPEGPAAALDIKSGDLLMAVAGKDTAMLSIQGSRQLLMGKPGSTVTIILRRPNQDNKTIVLTRMASSQIKDKRMRQMIEHARERHTEEETQSAPLIVCQMSEPGPSVLEFYTKQSGQNKLLLEEEKHGLSVKHIALDDAKNAKLKALLQAKNAAPIYYFAGILTTLGHFERRPLTAEILANHLKKINWTPGQDSLHQAMIAQYEEMRKQSWQPSQNQRAILLNSNIANPRREEAISAICRYVQLHNSSSKAAKSMLAPEAIALGLPPMDKLTFESSNDNINIVGDSFAVARTRLSNPLPLDVYFYLRRDKDWKITAARALACTGPLNAIVSQLEKKSQLSDEENSTLKNLKLTLSTDIELKKWFQANKAALEELVRSGESLAASSSIILYDSRSKFTTAAADSAVIKEKLQALHLSSLSKVDDKQMEIIIGGVTDNTVGFLYAPDNKPPLIGPTEYIWVEKIADNWYLFRTT